jgi:hypothetical protein
MEAKHRLESLLDELSKANSLPRLSSAVSDVDQVIELLSDARERIAGGWYPRLPPPLLVLPDDLMETRPLTWAPPAMDPHTASLNMTKLQNPIKFAFGKINDDLKAASSSHKKVGRSLDKACTHSLRPSRPRTRL